MVICVSAFLARAQQADDTSFALNLRRNWISTVAVCAVVMGMAMSIYFIIYANR